MSNLGNQGSNNTHAAWRPQENSDFGFPSIHIYQEHRTGLKDRLMTRVQVHFDDRESLRREYMVATNGVAGFDAVVVFQKINGSSLWRCDPKIPYSQGQKFMDSHLPSMQRQS